jgi:predicted Rossmann fold nucleotide-binding protein DprA/Smf involved in DNA uptake
VLGETPATADALAAAAELDLPEALGLLLRLRWAGLAEQAPGQRWRRAGPGRA